MRALALLAASGCYYNTLAWEPQQMASQPALRITNQQVQIGRYKRIVRPHHVVKVDFPDGVREMQINELLADCSPEEFQINKPPDGFPNCPLLRAQRIVFGRQRELNTELIFSASLVGTSIGLLGCSSLCDSPYDKVATGSFVTISIGFLTLVAVEFFFGLETLSWIEND